MDTPHTHAWKPIEDLPANWAEMSDPRTGNLVATWLERAETLKDNQAYNEFLAQLRREWAIETGQIERLYAIDDGASRTLIEKGLDAAFIGREDVYGDDPYHVVSMVKDQHQAIEGLYDFVTGNRQLTLSYIKQLHQIMTGSQDYCEAVDTLGTRVQTRLIRGDWKRQPNNIQFEDGTRFEFCPPEQVQSEMERLVDLHNKHLRLQVAPEIEAAWLHHRFTLIHPFQDGNGRIARCLATLVLLKSNWFPLVVTSNDRPAYYSSLRIADRGNIIPLIRFIADNHERAVRSAIRASDQISQQITGISKILEISRNRLHKKNIELDAKRVQAHAVFSELHKQCTIWLRDVAIKIDKEVRIADSSFSARVFSAAHNEPNADYYKIQIVECAKSQNYFANFGEYRAWTVLKINMRPRTEVLFSFHAMGYDRGTYAITAMFYQRESQKPSGKEKEIRFGPVLPLCSSPFTLTYRDDVAGVLTRFRDWFDETLENGLRQWTMSL